MLGYENRFGIIQYMWIQVKIILSYFLRYFGKIIFAWNGEIFMGKLFVNKTNPRIKVKFFKKSYTFGIF